jgi:TRAP-type mannitol/chloroaromatic compound transport system permease small subunit
MGKALHFIDWLSIWSGRACAWAIVALTLMISYEVFSRYALGAPHAWVFDVSAMFYGLLFMMAGAYTLAQGGHVRGDVLYGFFPARLQAGIDLVLYIVFFIPGIVALAWAGWIYAGESWAINEHSSISADGPPIYPFKMIIPAAGILLLLQGIVEIARCLRCFRDGKWPRRAGDVEEVDVEKLKEMVHVSDEDIAALDRYVIEQEKEHGHQGNSGSGRGGPTS